MVKFTMSMDWDGFEDEARKAYEKEITERLRKSGIKDVGVRLGKRSGSKWPVEFSGPEDQVEKAKGIFGG